VSVIICINGPVTINNLPAPAAAFGEFPQGINFNLHAQCRLHGDYFPRDAAPPRCADMGSNHAAPAHS